MRHVPVLVTFALLVSPVPASAFHSALPALAQGADTDHGWAAYKIETDGAMFTIEVESPATRGQYTIGLMALDAAGRFIQLATFTNFPSHDGTYVEIRHGEYRENRFDPVSGSGKVGFATTLNNPKVVTNPRVGVIHVVAYWSGEGMQWTHALRAAPGVTLLASSSGERAFFHRSHEFSSLAQVQAWPRERVDLPDGTFRNVATGASAQVGGALVIDVENVLVGAFRRETAAFGLMSVETAAGVEPCTIKEVGATPVDDPGLGECNFYHAAGPGAHGPGRYTFKLDHVGAVSDFQGEMYLIGADVRLPS